MIVQWSGQSLKPRGRKHSNFDDSQTSRLFSRSFAKLKMSTKETFGRYHVISFSAGLHNIHSHDHQNQEVTKLAKHVGCSREIQSQQACSNRHAERNLVRTTGLCSSAERNLTNKDGTRRRYADSAALQSPLSYLLSGGSQSPLFNSSLHICIRHILNCWIYIRHILRLP